MAMLVITRWYHWCEHCFNGNVAIPKASLSPVIIEPGGLGFPSKIHTNQERRKTCVNTSFWGYSNAFASKVHFFCVFEVLAFDLYQIYIYICIYIPALHVCMFWSSMHIPPIIHMIPGFIHLVPYVLPANLCTEKLASAQLFSQRLRECIHWDVCKGWFVAGLTTSKLSVKLGQTMEKER